MLRPLDLEDQPSQFNSSDLHPLPCPSCPSCDPAHDCADEWAGYQVRAELQPPEQQFMAVVATQLDGPPPYVAQYVPWERNSPGAVSAAVQGVSLPVQPHNPLQRPEVPIPMVAPIPLQPLPGARPAEVEPLVLSLARTLKWCSILDLLFLLLYGFLDF